MKNITSIPISMWYGSKDAWESWLSGDYEYALPGEIDIGAQVFVELCFKDNISENEIMSFCTKITKTKTPWHLNKDTLFSPSICEKPHEMTIQKEVIVEQNAKGEKEFYKFSRSNDSFYVEKGIFLKDPHKQLQIVFELILNLILATDK